MSRWVCRAWRTSCGLANTEQQRVAAQDLWKDFESLEGAQKVRSCSHEAAGLFVAVTEHGGAPMCRW
jgi:hypothetical protein